MDIDPFIAISEIVTEGGDGMPSFDKLSGFVGFQAKHGTRQNYWQVAVDVRGQVFLEKFLAGFLQVTVVVTQTFDIQRSLNLLIAKLFVWETVG